MKIEYLREDKSKQSKSKMLLERAGVLNDSARDLAIYILDMCVQEMGDEKFMVVSPAGEISYVFGLERSDSEKICRFYDEYNIDMDYLHICVTPDRALTPLIQRERGYTVWAEVCPIGDGNCVIKVNEKTVDAYKKGHKDSMLTVMIHELSHLVDYKVGAPKDEYNKTRTEPSFNIDKDDESQFDVMAYLFNPTEMRARLNEGYRLLVGMFNSGNPGGAHDSRVDMNILPHYKSGRVVSGQALKNVIRCNFRNLKRHKRGGYECLMYAFDLAALCTEYYVMKDRFFNKIKEGILEPREKLNLYKNVSFPDDYTELRKGFREFDQYNNDIVELKKEKDSILNDVSNLDETDPDTVAAYDRISEIESEISEKSRLAELSKKRAYETRERIENSDFGNVDERIGRLINTMDKALKDYRKDILRMCEMFINDIWDDL